VNKQTRVSGKNLRLADIDGIIKTQIEKYILSVKRNQMNLVSTICQAMYGSGVQIGMPRTIMFTVQKITPKDLWMVPTVLFVVVVRTSSRVSCVRIVAATVQCMVGLTVRVSSLPCQWIEDCHIVYL
jgi:hypothetical protein